MRTGRLSAPYGFERVTVGYYALSPKGVRELPRWTAALTGQ